MKLEKIADQPKAKSAVSRAKKYKDQEATELTVDNSCQVKHVMIKAILHIVYQTVVDISEAKINADKTQTEFGELKEQEYTNQQATDLSVNISSKVKQK